MEGMRKTLVHLLGFSALVWACGTQPHAAPARDAGAPPQPDAAAERDAGAPDAGAMSNSDAPACDVERCEARGEELAKSLMTSKDIAPSVKGGECARVDIDGAVTGMACTCITSNGWIYIGPKGAGCFVRGRAGDCLWDDKEFEPCTMGDPKCQTLCTDLNDRYAADAAKSFDVELRSSTCRNGSCRHVLRVENACITDHSLTSGRHFDCTLSDDEILDREDRAQ